MSHPITRKKFLQATAALVIAPSLACDDEEGEEAGEAEGGDCGGGVAGTVAGNHGHEAMLDAAAITGGMATDLDIQGSSGHTHAVSLSTAEITSIAAGERVTVTSSSVDAHTHDVTFEC